MSAEQADAAAMDEYRESLRLSAEVADEVREIITELSTREVPPAELVGALGLARALKAKLDGEKRPRWYEVGKLEPGMDRSVLEDSYNTQSPFRGSINALAAPMAVEEVTRDDGSRAVVATLTFSRAYEGPPNGVHGGFVAAVFDDFLGAAQTLAQTQGVTGRLTVHYRKLTPIETELRLEGWIDHTEGRRTVAKATMHAGETLCAEAEALFLAVDFEKIKAQMQA